jgi:hypothetical protein
MHLVVLGLLTESLEFAFEDEVLVVEGEHVGRGDGHLEDGLIEDAQVGPRRLVPCQLFADDVVYVGLEGRLAHALTPELGQIEPAQDDLLLAVQLAALVHPHLLDLPQLGHVLVLLVLNLGGLAVGRRGESDLVKNKVDFKNLAHGRLKLRIVRLEEMFGGCLAQKL